MDKSKAKDPGELNWADYKGSLPTQAVVRPRGARKAELIARVEVAFDKLRQTA